jgi:hypothetical protein
VVDLADRAGLGAAGERAVGVAGQRGPAQVPGDRGAGGAGVQGQGNGQGPARPAAGAAGDLGLAQPGGQPGAGFRPAAPCRRRGWAPPSAAA